MSAPSVEDIARLQRERVQHIRACALKLLGQRAEVYSGDVGKELRRRHGERATFTELRGVLEQMAREGLLASELRRPAPRTAGLARRYYRLAVPA